MRLLSVIDLIHRERKHPQEQANNCQHSVCFSERNMGTQRKQQIVEKSCKREVFQDL
jgi:hypothetical protein